MLAQKCAPGFTFEVIIVDNNSNDKTRAVVESFIPIFQQTTTRNLRYTFEPQQGKSFALNRGILSAKGHILAFTDDDVVIDEKWLAAIQECFTVYSCDAVGGRVLPLYPAGIPQWIKDNSRLLVGPIVMYDYGEGTISYRKPVYEFIGANFAFKKEVFIECGPFRTDIGPARGTTGEDCEYISRLHKMNRVLYYCGQALVWHPVDLKRANLQYIYKWNRQLGRYRFLVDEKGILDETLVYVGGIPRYLIGEIIRSGLMLLLKAVNRTEFLKEWIRFSTNLGRASEMRRAYQEARKQEQDQKYSTGRGRPVL